MNNTIKWMAASDIHGSALYCKKLLEAFEREKADRLLLLGDLLYHGPRNDLPDQYNPKEVAGMLNAYKSRIVCVRGNCEAEADQMVLEFPVMADYALLPLDKRLIFATHGHIHGPDRLPALQKGDILLCGHTHVPACRNIEGIWYCSPGSVSMPKEGSQRGYMILEGTRFSWKDLEGTLYMEKDLGSRQEI